MTTLITGASSGIGMELAGVCAAAGHDLVLVARNEPRLHALRENLAAGYGLRATVIPADLALPSAPETIEAAVNRLGLTIDVLINNAGFGTNGRFARLETQREMDELRVNIAALTHLTRLMLPAMLRRRSGRIMNVSSTAGFQAGPYMAVYYATKAYIISFTEALAEELRGSGVTATVLCPGPTRTEFQHRAGMRNVAIASDLLMMDPLSVARAGFEGMMKGRVMVIPGLSNRIGVSLVRLLPRRLVRRLVGELNRKRM
jgi:short-subunit dehydrogenase